ncbi:MAG: PilZ domain-containing protein [Deltaproteobacteria bacterium]|nr:PilZ domain-containing protein [Deltaproteobacteria bacterium]
MSNATSGGSRGTRGSSAERRDDTAPRLRYEALVEVGAGAAGGFEAESLDLSLDGMRLRTAYLPEAGERLVCRFDGYGGQIVVEGEVAWCNSEERGGEFGVRFTGLDQEALFLLQDMCAPPSGDTLAEHDEAEDGALPGSRVRLHIQGLGSPMRARVRDVARGEVLVGSNLEFLRVGRDIELEDVEQGGSRVAHIEHVGVDIDPETSIPQLVVALSYERQPVLAAPELAAPELEHEEEEEDLTTAPYQVRQGPPPHQEAAQRETTPEPAVIDTESAQAEEYPIDETPSMHSSAAVSAAPPAARPRISRPAPEARDRFADHESEDDGSLEAAADDSEQELSESPPPVTRMAVARVGALAKKLGPPLASAGAGARSMMGKLIGAIRARREAKREQRAARTPKRTTAEPPSGVLRSDGRRLVRDQRASDPSPEPEPPPAPSTRKRTVFGALIGIMAVLAIYFGSSHLSQQQNIGRDGAAAAPGDGVPALAAPAPMQPNPGAATQGGAVATANVPLFGATPMSTTEAVPVPPDPNAEPGAGAAQAADEEDKSKAKTMHLDKEWGMGAIHNPTILRLKLDGKLDGISGTETATGFKIVVPGRKSVSSAAGLARRDKRLSDVNVVNFPDRAEINVQFKGEVPPFVAKAKGKRLIIEIGGVEKKKKKSSKKKSSKKKSSKKKSSKKSDKKKSSKKSDKKKSSKKKSG